MQIVSISAAELERFLALSDQTDPEESKRVRKRMRELWESGHSRPSWSFLAQENGRDIGRLVYELDAEPHEIRFFGVELPWQADYLAVGKALLTESLKTMAAQGMRRAIRQINSQWKTAEQQQQVLESMGFTLRQSKSAFVLTMPETPVVVPDRLTYRSLEEVGEAAFIDAMRQASVHTLDRDDQKAIAGVGLQQMAEEFFATLQNDYWAYQPAWWQLAYAADGALVGFVQPLVFRENPQEGTIGYIGVVPEQRGHHYVDDLLLKAHRIWQEAGVQKLYSDTDTANFPMIGAFQRAGYKDYGTNWIYQLDLAL